MWGKPVAFIFIRPERYTYEFIEAGETLTLSFLGEAHKDIHKICGSQSGRNIDKVAATGLKPQVTPDGNITYEQARLTLECRKLYADMIKPEQFWMLRSSIMVWRRSRQFPQDVHRGNPARVGQRINSFPADSFLPYLSVPER